MLAGRNVMSAKSQLNVMPYSLCDLIVAAGATHAGNALNTLGADDHDDETPGWAQLCIPICSSTKWDLFYSRGRNSGDMLFSDRLFLSTRDYANQIGQPCGIHIAYSDPIEIACPETDYMKTGMVR